MLITGFGNTPEGAENIRAGKQAVTVGRDRMVLNDRCVLLVDDMLQGKEPEVNDTESCNNNAVIVPAYLCSFTLITLDNLPRPEQPETTGAADATTASTAPSAPTQP